MENTTPNITSLQGIGGSSGKVAGDVVVLNDISQIEFFSIKDKIVVLPYTTPKITPYLLKIKGIITEKGGMTSHAALLGREFGIPVVLGIDNATKIIASGQRVMVDGTKGKIEIFKKNSIMFAQWDITGICNLRCVHCRAWRLRKINQLSTEEALNLLDQLSGLKIQTLNFSGGEPFLRKDIFQLLEHSRNFPLITITTNGTMLWRKDWVKKLSCFKNIRISVSLDGLKDIHDAFRQVPGTFDRVTQAIKNLTKHKIRTSIRFTLSSYNTDQALPLYELIARHCNIESFNIRGVLPAGRATSSLMPSKKIYKETIKKLFNATKKWKIPIISGDPILLPLFPQLLGDVWRQMGKRVYSEICGGCLAGDEIIYIKPNGDVGACAYLPITAGNVKRQSLVEIINKMKLFQKLNNYKEKLLGNCGKCRFKYLCGGCRAAALVLNNHLYAEDPRCLIH